MPFPMPRDATLNLTARPSDTDQTDLRRFGRSLISNNGQFRSVTWGFYRPLGWQCGPHNPTAFALARASADRNRSSRSERRAR